MLIIQDDNFNHSRISTIIAATITSNTELAIMPGNVFLPAATTGLPKDSVVNVTQIVTIDRKEIDPHPLGRIPSHILEKVDAGLRLVLDL